MFDSEDKLRILVLEDDELDKMQIKRLLAKSSLSGCEVEYTKLLSDVLNKLEISSFQVILSDLNVPDSIGIKTVTEMNKKCPDTAIIAITGVVDKELGRQAIIEGAQDYLVKGEFDEYDLSKAIENAIYRKQAEIKIRQ